MLQLAHYDLELAPKSTDWYELIQKFSRLLRSRGSSFGNTDSMAMADILASEWPGKPKCLPHGFVSSF